MPTYRGAFHLHSRYSYDSEIPISEMAELLKQRGFSFALMSEHVYHRAENRCLSEEELRNFIADCRRYSSPDFLMIPGLEFSCCDNKVHIIVTPLSEPFALNPIDNISKVIEAAHRRSALAVLVHPFFAEAYRRLTKEAWAHLDGFEVWNYGYQKWHGPSPAQYLKFRRWFKDLPELKAFAGIDLHRKSEVGEVFMEMELPELKQEWVFRKLKDQDYKLGAMGRHFDSKGKLKNYLSHWIRQGREGVKRVSVRWLSGK